MAVGQASALNAGAACQDTEPVEVEVEVEVTTSGDTATIPGSLITRRVTSTRLGVAREIQDWG